MKKPNILLLFSDQHNAGVTGFAGHPDVKTPNLDALAESGTAFSRAYCQNAICQPSRASLMCGLYPRTIGILDNPDKTKVLDGVRPLAGMLKDHGYTTAAFGKRHLPGPLDEGWDEKASHLHKESPEDSYVSWIEKQDLAEEFARDWAAEFGRGPAGSSKSDTSYPTADLGTRTSSLPDGKSMEAWTAERSIDFLKRQTGSDQPFFLWSSFYRPHQPYNAGQKYLDLYDVAGVRLPESLSEDPALLPPMMREWRKRPQGVWNLGQAGSDPMLYRRYITSYYALVSEIDHYIGEIISALKVSGQLDNTIIIYTSDHGDFVGAHGMVEKCALGHNVYEDTLWVPLIISWPEKFKQGQTSQALTELVDLFPTIMELSGISDAGQRFELAGRSLVPVLEKGSGTGRDYAISENWSQLTVITNRYKYGKWLPETVHPERDFRSFGDMLFDRDEDPLELKNLVEEPELASVKKKLLEHIDDWIARIPSDGKRELEEVINSKREQEWQGQVISEDVSHRLTLIGPWQDRLWIVPTPGAKAVYELKVPADGKYDLELWYGPDPNSDHASDARFLVDTGKGETEFTVNMREKTEVWQLLSRFVLRKGWTLKVILNASEADGNLIKFKVRLK